MSLEPEPQPAVAEEGAQPPAAASPARLLLVDDEPGLRTAVQAYLEDEGFQVTTAVDGEDGWAKAQELLPDLVISDVMMPRLDGYGLLRKLRDDERLGGIALSDQAAEHPDHLEDLGHRALVEGHHRVPALDQLGDRLHQQHRETGEQQDGVSREAGRVRDQPAEGAVESAEVPDHAEKQVLAAGSLRSGDGIGQSLQQGVDPFASVQPARH